MMSSSGAALTHCVAGYQTRGTAPAGFVMRVQDLSTSTVAQLFGGTHARGAGAARVEAATKAIADLAKASSARPTDRQQDAKAPIGGPHAVTDEAWMPSAEADRAGDTDTVASASNVGWGGESSTSVRTSRREATPRPIQAGGGVRLTFGNADEALDWANYVAKDLVGAVQGLDDDREILSDSARLAAHADLDAEYVETFRNMFARSADSHTMVLNNAWGTLEKTFQIEGEMFTVAEDGRLSLNAFEVRHERFGLLLKVDAAGAITIPSGAVPAWHPQEGRVVDKRV